MGFAMSVMVERPQVQLNTDVMQSIKDYALAHGNMNADAILKTLNYVRQQPNLCLTLNQIRESCDQFGYCMVRNVPIDDNLTTPKEKKTYVSETALLFLSALLGNPHCYEEENEGAYFHNVTPVATKKMDFSSKGSERDLELHTEIAYDYDKPDYLLLLGLRLGQNIPTMISFVDSMLAQLDQGAYSQLCQNDYLIRKPFSFVGCDDTYYRRPIIQEAEHRNNYFFNFTQDVIFGITKNATDALQTAKKLLYASIEKIYITPGSALIIDNHRLLHGRPGFQSKNDSSDRWLQRLYVKGA